MKDCKASRKRHGVRRGMAVLMVGGISLLLGRGLASEISHSDYYDYAMKSFYIEKISLEADSLRIQARSLDPKVTKFEFTINGQPAPDGIVQLPRTIEPRRYDFHASINLTVQKSAARWESVR